MTKVRTTFNPELVLEVDDATLVDLERQGLLHSREYGDDTPIPDGAAAWDAGRSVAVTTLDTPPIIVVGPEATETKKGKGE